MGKSHRGPAVRDLDQWQIDETLAALEEARAGDFVTEDEFDAFCAKWGAGGSLSAEDQLADEREQELDVGGAEAVPIELVLARLDARFRPKS